MKLITYKNHLIDVYSAESVRVDDDITFGSVKAAKRYIDEQIEISKDQTRAEINARTK